MFDARETGRRWLASGVTAVVALSPPAFVYATEIYPEMPAAFCVVLALLLMRSATGLRRCAGLVLTVSALAWLGMKYIPVGVVIAAFYAWNASPRQRWWLAGLGALSAVAYVGWHLSTFGALTPYQTNLVYEGASATSVIASHVAFEDRVYRLWGVVHRSGGSVSDDGRRSSSRCCRRCRSPGGFRAAVRSSSRSS